MSTEKPIITEDKTVYILVEQRPKNYDDGRRVFGLFGYDPAHYPDAVQVFHTENHPEDLGLYMKDLTRKFKGIYTDVTFSFQRGNIPKSIRTDIGRLKYSELSPVERDRFLNTVIEELQGKQKTSH